MDRAVEAYGKSLWEERCQHASISVCAHVCFCICSQEEVNLVKLRR